VRAVQTPTALGGTAMIDMLSWAVLGLVLFAAVFVAWTLLVLPVAVVIGRVIRGRDEQTPHHGGRP
jgi:uncharacterized membrane protein